MTGRSGHPTASSPAASLHPALDAALPDTCLQPLLTRGCPSAVLIRVGPTPWLPPQTSPLRSPEVLWGTASILALGVQGSPFLNVGGGLRTQADVVLLQQATKVLLGSLQEAAEGLAVVTDIKRQEEAVTEPEKHTTHGPGHGLMAAETLQEAQQGRGSVFSPSSSSLRMPLALVLTRVHKLVHVIKGVKGCVVGRVDPC